MKPQEIEDVKKVIRGEKKDIYKDVGNSDSSYNNNNNKNQGCRKDTASPNIIYQYSDFFNLILNSRFHYNANLRLAYYLLHAQRTSVSEARKVLGFKSRSVVYDSILLENPCFVSAHRNGIPKGQGGHQRLIILGEDARPFLSEIEALAFIRLGEDICLDLRMKATKARKIIKKEENRHNKILKSLAKSRVSNPDQYPEKRRYWASRWKIGLDDVDTLLTEFEGSE